MDKRLLERNADMARRIMAGEKVLSIALDYEMEERTVTRSVYSLLETVAPQYLQRHPPLSGPNKRIGVKWLRQHKQEFTKALDDYQYGPSRNCPGSAA